jgi:pSer/pThr/pTyr-binding forkhead associated (FHA) protein
MDDSPLPAVIEVPEPPPGADDRALVIGRSIACDLILGDPTVSRWHAELVRHEDGWIVRDIGSTNGTRVNGWRVRTAVVAPGDVLALGAQRLVMRPRRGASTEPLA